MVMTCCAYNCTKRASKKSNAGHITFHCFPKDEQLLKKWIAAIRREDWKPTKNSRVCSLHFTSESYETSGWSSRPKLKCDAVPSIFDFPALLRESKTQRPSLRERNVPAALLKDEIQDRSPPSAKYTLPIVPEDRSHPPNKILLSLLTESKTENSSGQEIDVPLHLSTNEEINLPSHFSPEVIIKELPTSKRKRKCYLGDFKNDSISDLPNEDAVTFAAVARNLIEKKNKQIRLLRQKNRRLEKKVADLEALLVDINETNLTS